MQRDTAISELKAPEVARRLGLSRSYAHDLIKGHKTPSLDVAAQIERAFGVPVSAWVARLPRSSDHPGAAA